MSDNNQSINNDELNKLKERLNAIREVALNYIEKKHDGIDSKDIEKLEDMQKQSEEIRKIASNIPLLGDICLIAADLTILLKRAIVLMFENLNFTQKPVAESIYVNDAGIKESDNMAKNFGASKKADGLGKKIGSEKVMGNVNKMVARSEYFGYEIPKDEEKDQNNQTNSSLQEEQIAKERLARYNEDVKARGEANKAESEKSSKKSETGSSQRESQPSKD